ncbi:hypothetical protein [Alicyclobacillus mali (ex Roth et al. 2021)]|uniref:hypothetical protein n=1 Tax=Alicyclobacillus mali (ex Roth et al. 2021) TaxID=1123961 RepID=UPI001A8C578C|nr:hypothetical protein [Alicyclobacillus mali (ex Roth et al. 2021)]
MRSWFASLRTPCRKRLSKRQRLAILALTMTMNSMLLANGRYLHLGDGFWGGFALGIWIMSNVLLILNAAMLLRERF